MKDLAESVNVKKWIDNDVIDCLKRLGLRWAMFYLILYIASIAMMVPGLHTWNFTEPNLWFVSAYSNLWFGIALPWVAEHVLHLPHLGFGPEAGGSSLATCVQFVCMLVIALAGAVLWTGLDSDRQREHRLYEATRVLVRYVLAAITCLTGFDKIFHLQFPYPGPSLLITPVGDLSPIGLMWTFMGYSTLYSSFGGIMEFAGGVLLFFRRTTTLGALMIAGVMTNVIMMDFSYDLLGPIFYAGQLMVMAIFLMAPDILRFAPALLLYRAVPAVEITHVSPRSWMRPVSLVLKVLVIGWILYYASTENLNYLHYTESLKTPLDGLYRVERFSSSGKRDQMPVVDGKFWRQIAIQPFTGYAEEFDLDFKTTMTVRTADDRIQYFPLQVDRTDATHGRLILKPGGGDTLLAPIVFRYVVVYNPASPGSTTPGNEILVLDRNVNGATISMRLERLDMNNYYLKRYKFGIYY